MNQAEKKSREQYDKNKAKDLDLMSDKQIRKQVFDQDDFYRVFNARADRKVNDADNR